MEEIFDEEQIKVLWQDEFYAFLDKPADLLIHRSIFSSDRDTLVKRLYSQFGQPPLPVHRLDRPVSGVLATSFTKDAASQLSALFRTGQIRKTYWAVVRGFIPEQGTLNSELKDYETGIFKEAVTDYRRLQTAETDIPSKKFPTSRYSLVEVRPGTGRFHQIRRHLAGLGYPIAGDTSHGDTFFNHHFTENLCAQGLMLHAVSLEFKHPFTGEELKITAPLPARFQEVFRRLQWDSVNHKE